MLMMVAATEAPVLWGNLHAGMTKAEVRAAQPTVVVPIAQDCRGRLFYTYKSGQLVAVEMDGLNPSQECRLIVAKSLSSKYGEG